MKYIASRENPIFKSVLRLKQKRQRDKEGLCLLEGKTLVEEGLSCGLILTGVFFRDTLGEGRPEPAFQALAEELEEKQVPVALIRGDLFNALPETETPSGILAVAKKKVWNAEALFGPPGGNLLVADRIQDPGNLGTLIRTADAAGFRGLILLKDSVELYSPKVLRSAAGSLFRLPFLLLDTPEAAVELLKSRGKAVLCSCPHEGLDYDRCPMGENIALVVGNEAAGISEGFLKAADLLVRIPMAGRAESLNAAVAAGILMFESLRQRRSCE